MTLNARHQLEALQFLAARPETPTATRKILDWTYDRTNEVLQRLVEFGDIRWTGTVYEVTGQGMATLGRWA